MKTGEEQADVTELIRRLERAERDLEVVLAQREHARARFDHVFKVMMSVYNLAPPGKDIHLPDGRVMRFIDPNAAETLHHLGAAIHAIPERLAAAPALAEQSGNDDARDAARYRWLRGHSTFSHDAGALRWNLPRAGRGTFVEQLDANIDAAMSPRG